MKLVTTSLWVAYPHLMKKETRITCTWGQQQQFTGSLPSSKDEDMLPTKKSLLTSLLHEDKYDKYSKLLCDLLAFIGCRGLWIYKP